MTYQIAIDGPAGAGKSTIAKAVAKKMACHGLISYYFTRIRAVWQGTAIFLTFFWFCVSA